MSTLEWQNGGYVDSLNTEIKRLRAAVSSVRKLHAASYDSDGDEVWKRNARCDECRAAYPCDTARLVAEPSPVVASVGEDPE